MVCRYTLFVEPPTGSKNLYFRPITISLAILHHLGYNYGMSRQSDLARFWLLVDDSAGPDQCWKYNGALTVNFPYLHDAAYRITYEAKFGSIGSGLILHHKCLHHWCVNPLHTTPLTKEEHFLEHVRLRYLAQIGQGKIPVQDDFFPSRNSSVTRH